MKLATPAPITVVLVLGLAGSALAKPDLPGTGRMAAERIERTPTDAGYASLAEAAAEYGH